MQYVSTLTVEFTRELMTLYSSEESKRRAIEDIVYEEFWRQFDRRTHFLGPITIQECGAPQGGRQAMADVYVVEVMSVVKERLERCQHLLGENIIARRISPLGQMSRLEICCLTEYPGRVCSCGRFLIQWE